jgi:hypothetical protein
MHRRLSIMAALAVFSAAQAAFGQCASWTPLVNVSHDAGHFAVDGNLAIDSSGAVHLVYQTFLDTYGEAVYTTNQGGSWSTPVALGSLGGKGSTPKIVITPDSQLHAFYGKSGMYWRTKPVVGGSWTGAVQIDAELPSGSFIQAVTVDSAGGIYFLFGNLFKDTAPVRNGIYGKYKPLGGNWGTLEVVYGNSDDGNWPRGNDVAARGNTLWVSIGIDGDVYFKKKPSTGVWPAGKGTRLVTDAGGMRFAFSPVSNEMGAFYGQSLSCTDPCEDDPWYEVYVKYSYDDGATWSAPDNISDLTDDIDRTPSAVYDSTGNLHVVWEGFCCDHKLRMRYRGRFGGVWDSPITILTSHVGGHIPNSLAVRGTDLHMVFSDSNTNIGLYDVVYTTSTASLPRIDLSASSLSRSVLAGGSLADESFTVRNGCVGTLNYEVSRNQPWLVVSPTVGSATTETDVITFSYPGVPQLRAGNHQATVTVAGNAMNTPRTVAVQVIVRSVKPDFDGDGDVDQGDFGLLQTCFSGSFVPPLRQECEAMILDGDEDIDGDDLSIFAGCVSGPDTPADMGCAPLYP